MHEAGPPHSGAPTSALTTGYATPAIPTAEFPYPTGGQPGGHFAPSYVQEPPVNAAAPVGRPGPRRSWLAAIALALVVLLMLGVAAQAYLITDLHGQLGAANQRAAAAKDDADARLKGLEARTRELEQRAGNTLDAAAVAASVLPSVFLVHAGDFVGTAFAFGAVAEGGGTNLLTNYHVVDQVYKRGDRSVDIEQQNKRFTVRIVKIDEKADLALLVASQKFPRLPPAAEPAKPGQPIVVVGAPLGLDDSVTSGVVSALRGMPNGTTVLQFDAAINPGNSGGPVVNAQKQVVGVVNAKARGAEGISLGIPVGVVCQAFVIC
jgi:putative serine protease PepD